MRKIPEHCMQRLSDYDLAILFYLLQGSVLHIPYEANKIPLSKLQRKFISLGRIVNIIRESGKVFENDVHNGIYTLSLIEERKRILKEYLQRYYELLVAGYLKSKTNVLQWKVAREEFEQRVSNYNLNDFHTNSVEDIPLIIPELLELDYDLNIKILKDSEPECIIEGNTLENFYRNFRFECSLDLNIFQKRHQEFTNMLSKSEPVKVSDILEESNSTIIEEQVEPKRKKFSRQQQKMYNYLERKAKGGNFSFTKYDLSNFAPINGNGLSSAINRLNKQYQEIYNTENELIKYDRSAEGYVLNNVWGYKISD